MSDLLVTGASVFDGVDLAPGASVLVRGSRIEAVGDVPVPDGVEVDLFSLRDRMVPLKAEAARRDDMDILAGTDVVGVGLNGTSHGLSLHQELRLIIECGVSTLDAIRGVTGTSARRRRMDDRGRIERGRQADLLLVDGDPPADVADLLKIKDVWRRGTRFDRKTYDGNRAERERLSAEWGTKPPA